MAKGNFQRKMAEWMRGRNGSDELATCALLLALVFVILNLFLRTIFLSVVAVALLVYAWWRMASKNLEARENENGVFCEFLGPVRPWVRNPVAAAQEAKKYKHFTCPNCQQRIRVPRGKGNLRVRCPKCQERFKVRT